MLRLETNDGWWLVTHPDHAYLAGEFAKHWGNELFAKPEPRKQFLHAVYRHDDGWAARDENPVITKQGKPAAFSTELVGAYSAFEEIDLSAYLTVRRHAAQLMAKDDPYAAILISMHTHNLLSERADRSTIRPEQLFWLDDFLVQQSTLQRALRDQLFNARAFAPKRLTREALHRNFQLLQACDNLSLLSCVDYSGEATLLHPFTLTDGTTIEIQVQHIAERTFKLTPYPFDEPDLTFKLRARFVPGKTFATSAELATALADAPYSNLEVRITT
jgi:hypothetical protein